VCLIAADRDESLIASLPEDLALWAPKRSRPFNGAINTPDVVRGDGVVRAMIHPGRAAQREISKNTNLVDGRPWPLLEALTS